MKLDYPSHYTFVKFERSHTSGKKYDAILKHKHTGTYRRIPFGDVNYQQYKDKALGLFKHKDHLDARRRLAYRTRHKGEERFKFSSGWFSWHYLW